MLTRFASRGLGRGLAAAAISSSSHSPLACYPSPPSVSTVVAGGVPVVCQARLASTTGKNQGSTSMAPQVKGKKRKSLQVKAGGSKTATRPQVASTNTTRPKPGSPAKAKPPAASASKLTTGKRSASPAKKSKSLKQRKAKTQGAVSSSTTSLPDTTSTAADDTYYPFLVGEHGAITPAQKEAGRQKSSGDALIDTFCTLFKSSVPRAQYQHIALAEHLSGANMVIYEASTQKPSSMQLNVDRSAQGEGAVDDGSGSGSTPASSASETKAPKRQRVERPKLYVRGEAYPKRFSRRMRYLADSGGVAVPKSQRDTFRENIITVVAPTDESQPLRTQIATGANMTNLRKQAKRFCMQCWDTQEL